MSVLNAQQIMDILPHRSPFLLIDTVEELQPGVKCVIMSGQSISRIYIKIFNNTILSYV